MNPTNHPQNPLTPVQFGLRAILDIAIVVVVVCALAIGGSMLGCGHESRVADATQPRVSARALAVPTSGSIPAVPALASPGSPMVPAGAGSGTALGDSLPPDVVVSLENPVAMPGDIVEITAQGSDDVSAMRLSDGLGRAQEFARQDGSNVWRVLYRVPLGTAKDRVALSVTALNDLDRWRRVWVFIGIGHDAPERGSDTTTTHE